MSLWNETMLVSSFSLTLTPWGRGPWGLGPCPNIERASRHISQGYNKTCLMYGATEGTSLLSAENEEKTKAWAHKCARIQICKLTSTAFKHNHHDNCYMIHAWRLPKSLWCLCCLCVALPFRVALSLFWHSQTLPFKRSQHQHLDFLILAWRMLLSQNHCILILLASAIPFLRVLPPENVTIIV